MAEADSPKTTYLFVAVLGTVVVLAGLVIGVDQFFGISVREEISRKVLQPESSALRLLRSEEQAKLTHYQWADQKAGVVRLPVDRAMALVLQDWASRPEGFTPGTSDTVPGAAKPAVEKGASPKLDSKEAKPAGESKNAPTPSKGATAPAGPAAGSPTK